MIKIKFRRNHPYKKQKECLWVYSNYDFWFILITDLKWINTFIWLKKRCVGGVALYCVSILFFMGLLSIAHLPKPAINKPKYFHTRFCIPLWGPNYTTDQTQIIFSDSFQRLYQITVIPCFISNKSFKPTGHNADSILDQVYSSQYL